jgi:hypothetical protein
MNTEINSSEIILECLKEHGKGKLFFRADGLEFEEQRVQARHLYIESHPEINPEHGEAILKAAITPGMTREEAIAGWGLLAEDTRSSFGNVTYDQRASYACFTGLDVGARYALYLKDDVVVGVRQTDELVPPHELELTMRLAEENHGLFYFYDGSDGRLRGSNVDQYHMDWDTQHLRLYTIEIVHPLSLRWIEDDLKAKGLIRHYEIALLRLGFDSRTASDELRSSVALATLPYPRVKSDEASEQKQAAPTPSLSDSPIALPASALELSHDAKSVPLEKWFAYVAFGNRPEVAFPTIDHQVELLTVKWTRELLFRVEQVPLLVNGVSLYDLVQVEWQDGDLIPRFKRVAESSGHRTIRAVITNPEREVSIRRFAKLNTADRKRFRYENSTLAFTISESELDDIAKEWLGYLPLTWMYTDTLSQQ